MSLSKSLCASAVAAGILFATPCFSDTQAGFANIQKGNWLTGGSFSFADTLVTDGSNYKNLSLFVPLQYFVLDRLSVGAGLSLSYSSSHSDTDDTTQTSEAFGPAATYFFWQQDRLGLYVAASVLFEPTQYKVTYPDVFTDVPDSYTNNLTLLQLTAKLGFNYFINPSVAIGPAISYTNVSKLSGDGTYTGENYYSLSVGFSIFL